MSNSTGVPEIWVSASGNNKAAGTKTRPVRTLHHAVTLLRRKRRNSTQPTGGRIVLSGGTHVLTRPLILDHRDSRDEEVSTRDRERTIIDPVVICSAPGAKAVISGGRRINGWRETRVNGVRAWVATLPAVKRGTWNFTQLWVNGKRARRPRLPETGTYRIARRFSGPPTRGLAEQDGIFKAEDRFQYNRGELRSFKNLTDVEFVALHFWIQSRIPIAAINEKQRIVKLAYPARMQLTDNHSGPPAPYYLDNVFEALQQPGQWYLDRPSGRLYYVPRPGETPDTTEIIAPVADHLIRIEGSPDPDRHARRIELRDLTLSHCEHIPPGDGRRATPQAACHVAGAVQMTHARCCALVGCTVEHVGSYGIDINGDSSDCDVRYCTIRDAAAGGLKIFQRGRGPLKDHAPWYRPRRITVADCHIHDGGHRWAQAVGILIGNCSGIEVTHCHVHDFDYTGISVGWTWGYRESHTYGNVIEWNHIHDIGRGVLSDMGGIYTLGRQQGTRLRFNHVHHVDSRGYGGWGIYPDEGSSDILIECNLVHDTKCDPFSQHYGCDNFVRNNIFAFGRSTGMVGLSRFEKHNGFTFERNIVVTDGVPITHAPYNAPGHPMPCRFDCNLYHDVSGRRLDFGGVSWSAWRKEGQDTHSLVADPGFVNAAGRNFRLRRGSPAARIGFVPFDLSAVGPRKR